MVVYKYCPANKISAYLDILTCKKLCRTTIFRNDPQVYSLVNMSLVCNRRELGVVVVIIVRIAGERLWTKPCQLSMILRIKHLNLSDLMAEKLIQNMQ